MSEDPDRIFGPLSPLCALLPQAQARMTAAKRGEVRRHLAAGNFRTALDLLRPHLERAAEPQPSEPGPLEPPGALYLATFPGGEAVRIAAAGPEAAERRVRELFPGETFTLLQVDSPRPKDAG